MQGIVQLLRSFITFSFPKLSCNCEVSCTYIGFVSTNTKLFRIEDLKGDAKGKEYTIPFDKCWDIDEAEIG